ncbi:MAG: hypothetical protein ACOY93_02695 [Bacillota bacterium]
MASDPKQKAKTQQSQGSEPEVLQVRKVVPPVPLTAYTVRPDLEILHRHMRDMEMLVDEPAQASLPVVAGRRLGEISQENGLGTPRPSKLRLGLDETKRFLYIAPTHKDDPLGTEVRYSKGRVSVNLLTVFAPLDRYVEAGRREVYDLGITPGAVTFQDGFKSVSLYAFLTPSRTEPRRQMSEEAKAKRRATIERKKQLKAQANRARQQPPGEAQ